MAEDDADIASLVRYTLEAAGLRVRSYPNADQVISDAKKEHTSLLLLDVMLPGGDGLDLCGSRFPRIAQAREPASFSSQRGDSSHGSSPDYLSNLVYPDHPD